MLKVSFYWSGQVVFIRSMHLCQILWLNSMSFMGAWNGREDKKILAVNESENFVASECSRDLLEPWIITSLQASKLR